MSLSESVRVAIRDYTAGNPYQPGNTFNLNRIKCLVTPVLLKNVLDFTKGNQVRTACIMGTSRELVRRQLVRFNMTEYAKRLRDMAKW